MGIAHPRAAQDLPRTYREAFGLVGRRFAGAPGRLFAHREPFVVRIRRRVAPLRGRDQHSLVVNADDDAIGVEQLSGQRRDDWRERCLVGRAVDVAEDVEQDAQPVALEQGSSDELHQIAHRVVELRDRLRGQPRLVPCRPADAVDVARNRPGVLSAIDADLEIGQPAVGRLGHVGEGVDERTARLLEGLDARDGALRHDPVDDPPPDGPEAGADGQSIAPGGRRTQHLLGAPEPDSRRLVAGAWGPGRQELGEANHRPRFAAPETRVAEMLD